MNPPPEFLPALSANGFRVLSLEGACWIGIVQRGTEADKIMESFVQQQTDGLPAPSKPPEPKGGMLAALPGKGVGVFCVADAAWLFVVKIGSPEEKLIGDFVKQYGRQIPRPSA